ncbi:type I-G CRISPR-associated protein, Cas3-extension family [Kineosporia babensis]|uniref:Uncharacterized protein n=1 Tax=Kineosporia babensis TaxID=499548 RepID=A0A9X1T4R0_9ACTN|nr:hypothetical protein [Kineosporia babensis]MCD5316903.1 hypothetical protein [Kineosporia babensis]
MTRKATPPSELPIEHPDTTTTGESVLSLPALDGRTVLGFLAALGTSRLLRTVLPTSRIRLSWSRENASALLHSPLPDLDAVVDMLYGIVLSIPEGGVLPGLPADLPPRGEAPDRLRLPRADWRFYAESVFEATGDAGERWLSCLITDLSTDRDNLVQFGVFTATSGKQSSRTMLEKPLALVRENPQFLFEAFTSWRRVPGVSGEYLDHRVLFDAADAPDGTSAERGVPGATWLALMSYPLLRTTVTRQHPTSSGWQPLGPTQADHRLVWPLWSRPLDNSAAVTLLEHPLLEGVAPGRPEEPRAAALEKLSIFWINHAERRLVPDRQFAGVLAPTTQMPTSRPSRRVHRRGPR